MDPEYANPKISAIITTFNRADRLGRAIQSVLDQTYKNFELLILDNSSSDNTEEVVKKFNDARIRYIRHQPMGISEARNLGVKESKGEYVAFLDDDDEWLPKKLQLQLEIFENGDPRIGLVYGGFVGMDESGKEFRRVKPSRRGDVFEYCVLNRDTLTGAASVPMLRRSAIEASGYYNEHIKTYEDYELYLRLARKFFSDFTPEYIVKIYSHSGYRLGGRIKDALDTEKFVYDEFKDVIQKNAAADSKYLQVLGGLYCRVSELKEGRKYILRAIRRQPINFLAYVQYLLSFVGTSFYSQMHRIYKKYID